MGYLTTTLSKIWEATLSAIGSHLTLSLGGILFLGFPVAFWGAAYGYAIAAKSGIAVGLSVSIGIGLALLLGFVFAFFYRRLGNESFAVITLASVLAAEALIRSWDSLTGGVLGIAGVPRFYSGQTLLSLMLCAAIVACIGLALESLLAHSAFGRSLRALKENKSVLTAMGTSAGWTGQAAILFAALFAGIAGIFTAARVQFLDPSLGGFVLLIQVLTITIIANTPKTARLLTIIVIIVLLPEMLRFFDLPVSILGHARNFLYGLLLIFLIQYTAYTTPIKRYV